MFSRWKLNLAPVLKWKYVKSRFQVRGSCENFFILFYFSFSGILDFNFFFVWFDTKISDSSLLRGTQESDSLLNVLKRKKETKAGWEARERLTMASKQFSSFDNIIFFLFEKYVFKYFFAISIFVCSGVRPLVHGTMTMVDRTIFTLLFKYPKRSSWARSLSPNWLRVSLSRPPLSLSFALPPLFPP